MAEFDDPQLVGKSVSFLDQTQAYSSYGEGLRILELSEENVEKYCNFMSDFYARRRAEYPDKQVTRTASTMIRGSIFVFFSEKIQNPEWQEHCSSSLREVFHEWKILEELSKDFVKFYKSGSPLSDDEKKVFREFKLHYDYFCGIDHHNASTTLNSLTAILGNNSLKLKECYLKSIFIDRVKHYFHLLDEIIDISTNKL